MKFAVEVECSGPAPDDQMACTEIEALYDAAKLGAAQKLTDAGCVVLKTDIVGIDNLTYCLERERMLHASTRWNEYFMTITREVAERSTCTRAKVGAVIVRDRSILATGYNGSPAGMPHCLDVGCLVYRSETPEGEVSNCVRTIHAEVNAIAQAAKNGTAIRDASIYVTHTPCVHCFKVLLNTGVKCIFYGRAYKLETLEPLLAHANIALLHVE